MSDQRDGPNAFDYLEGPISTDPGTLADYEASLGEYLGASFGAAMDLNPAQLLLREGDFLNADLQALAGATGWVDEATAKREIAEAKLPLTVPANGISRFELDTLKYLKQREIERQSVMARRSGALTSTLGFAAGLGASATDPINVASAFVPIVQQTRYAQWVAQAAGAAQRAAVRAGVGAVEGAAGAALIEPLVYLTATNQQFDYSATDSFLNVAFGTALGGGLHVAGGSAFDFFNANTMKALKGLDEGIVGNLALTQRAADAAPESVKLDALHTMVRALEDDVPGDVLPVFGLTDRELAARTYDFSPEQIQSARAAVVAARVDVDPAQAAASLFQTIRALGGVKVRGADGQVTREGAEVLAVLGGARVPGLINNKRGVAPDYLREALTEDGWFKARDTGETDIQEMYDLLEAAARGEVPQRFGETRGKSVSAAAARELDEAGVKASDSVTRATMKVAEYRASRAREDLQTPDFEPDEITYREPGDEDDLAGPVTDDVLARFEPIRPPRDLAGLIEQSRADRTQDAFNRQFVDDALDVQASRAADEAVTKSEDLQTVSEDVAFLDQQIAGLKAREMWTKADDEAIAQGDDAAKAFEKEAAIYRAAAVCMMEG